MRALNLLLLVSLGASPSVAWADMALAVPSSQPAADDHWGSLGDACAAQLPPPATSTACEGLSAAEHHFWEAYTAVAETAHPPLDAFNCAAGRALVGECMTWFLANTLLGALPDR